MENFQLLVLFIGIVGIIWLSVKWRWKSWLATLAILVLIILTYFLFFYEPPKTNMDGSNILSTSFVYFTFTMVIVGVCLLFSAFSLFMSRRK